MRQDLTEYGRNQEMCGIGVVWGAARLTLSTAPTEREPESVPEAGPEKPHWSTAVDESATGALGRCGLQGAVLSAAGVEDSAVDTLSVAEQLEQLEVCLMRRGPDSVGRATTTPGVGEATIVAATLGMRGPVTQQPLQDANGNIFAWNGEVFGGIPVPADQNDTQIVFAELQRRAAEGMGDDCGGRQSSCVMSVLGSIEGPWSCIYWDNLTRSLWFGRDKMGRRSLLLGRAPGSQVGFTVASVVPPCCQGWDWLELPPSGMFQLMLEPSTGSGVLHHHPWLQPPPHCTVCSARATEPPESTSAVDAMIASSAVQLLEVLDRAVRRRVETAPIVATHQSIAAPDRGCTSANHERRAATAVAARLLEARCALCKDRIVSEPSAVRHFGSWCEGSPPHFTCEPCTRQQQQQQQQEEGEREIDGASGPIPACCAQALEIPSPTPTAISSSAAQVATGSGARVAVLFSGGVDCMVLAALAHRHVPADEPIDLLNVAFCNTDTGMPTPSPPQELSSRDTPLPVPVSCALPPDREGAIAGLAELQKLAPRRRWQLIQVNRSHDSALRSRPQLLPLMFPATTVMDFTISVALWSAASGEGTCYCQTASR